jgi:hypothetical protein
MIALDAQQLRNLAEHLDYLTQSAKLTGVQAAADTPDSVSMVGWPHSLPVERGTKVTDVDDGTTVEVYRLLVGGAYS